MTFPAHSPRRLLLTVDAVGGVWTYALELARALGERGVQIALASLGQLPSSAQRRQAAALENVQLFTSEFALEWMENPWAEVDAAGAWLLELCAEFEPDLVHLNGFAHATLPWPVPVLVVAHSCVFSWWRAVKGERAPERLDEYHARVEAGLRSAQIVVAPTRAMLRALEEEYAFSTPTQAIPNGRAPGIFSAREKEPFIATAGRLWDQAKNLALLDKIAGEVAWPIRFIGEAGRPGGATVVFTEMQPVGQLDEPALAAELGRAAIYAAPALYEPFGLAILEAGLSGCALVLSDLPSLREVWQNAAIFLPANEPARWRETLNALASDAAERARLGALAQARAQTFSTQRTADAYFATYRELLSARVPAEALAS